MKKLVVACLCLFAGYSWAGPFGVDMSYPYEKLDKGEELRPYFFVLDSVPKPSRHFDVYLAEATPSHGLCQIRGGSDYIETSVYGTELKKKFDQITDLVAKKYGNPYDVLDFLSAGSIWSEPRDYMRSLVKKERYLAQLWKASEGLSLPDDISVIYVEAKAIETSSGFISIRYEFTNAEDCRKYIEDGDSESL